MLSFKRVIVAISGGVDSAVAAFLLKSKGFEVEGVFMENWDLKDETGYCSSNSDFKDASEVCEQLEIKLHKLNFVKEYWNEVFCSLVKDYENGYTPNPDILCNKRIKFNYLHNYVVETLNGDAMATGHYARTNFGPYLEYYKKDKNVKLLKAKDTKKDQIFFLSQIKQESLRKTMFPLGELMKSEVKLIAERNGLGKFARKKESMGICFIGSRNFQNFIKDYIEDKPGEFIDIDTGKIMGKHTGFHQWTLGQRSCISGMPSAYFIARKHSDNSIILTKGTNHSFLLSKLFFTTIPHWISEKPLELENENVLNCDFKFQHSQNWVPCTIFECPRKGLIVLLNEPKRAITPGQYAVFSKNNECLGSARIVNTPITEFSLNYTYGK